MRILVTGGSGFVGSHVVDRLIAAGHRPRIIDLRRSPWHPPEEVDTVVGDVTDPYVLTRAMKGCEAVIHLAAAADVNQVHANPLGSEVINSRGTMAVLAAAAEAGVGRVLYGSTIWVYSECAEEEVDEETLLPAPSHFYTATKLAGELYCRAYAALAGLDFTILRFGIPYGPRAREAAVVPAFIRKALAGEPLTIAGSGDQKRSFVYVEDLAEGVVRGLAPVARNRVYNLAGREDVSVLEVAETVGRLVQGTEIVHTESRASDFGGKSVSSVRAEEELGWTASTPFREGAGRYFDWLQSQAELRRVLILTADIGEGHDLPARMLAEELQLERPGTEVEIVDGLAEVGRVVQWFVKDGSWFTFRKLPWVFDLQYLLLMKFPPTRWFGNRLAYRLGRRKILALIRRKRPDAVVSTYPGTTAVIGELRRRRLISMPTFSAITDLAGLRFWAHPGVDQHFVTHPESLPEVEHIAGADSVVWARPPTSSEFLAERSKADARLELELPADERIVLVSGGGWGIGDVAGAVDTALDCADRVICLAGHNEELLALLRSRFGSNPRVRVLGFTNQMSDLLAAADCLVHSTAGLTVLEALIRGCPVVSYGFQAGHLRANNRALRHFGLARTARSRRELADCLQAALREDRLPDPSFAAQPSPASLVLGGVRRVRPWPLWRVRLGQTVAAGAAAFALTAFTLGNDYAYPVFAKAFDLPPTTRVDTRTPQVGLLIDTPNGALPALAAEVRRLHAAASFGLTQRPNEALLDRLLGMGDQAVPRLKGGGTVRWLRTRHYLRKESAAMDLSGHRYTYVLPADGFTFGQYLLAHFAGGSPVRGAVRYGGGALGPVTRGDIIEVPAASTGAVDELVAELDRRGLRPVNLGTLMAGKVE